MQCPICSGLTWDNRETKKNPKAPDYKCRDKNCEGVIWPPRDGQTPQAAKSTVKTAHSAGPLVPGLDDIPHPADAEPRRADPVSRVAQVERQYAATLRFVLDSILPVLNTADIPVDGAAVNSMVATILIQSTKVT